MNKRVLAALLSLAMLPLIGCSLAQPDNTTDRSQTYTDRLVGVMITTEYLDLFDMETWLQDNLDQIAGSGELVLPEASEDARLYAKLNETEHRYNFEGVDGILLAGYQIQPDDASNAYWATDCGEGLCDVATSTHALDDGMIRELLGTLYIEHDYGELIFYLNPIYQTTDGALYLVPGTGLHISSLTAGTASQSVSQELTLTENGTEQTYSSKIEISFVSVQTAEKVIVIQMNDNNQELARDEFIPGQFPDEFVPLSDTAYLIVEEHSVGGVFRSLYQHSNDSFGVFYSPDGMLCIKDTVSIRWP